MPFKTTIVGDAGSGKTCLAHRFVYGKFEETEPTVGGGFFSKKVPGTDATLEIWDTAGAERYRSVTRVFYYDSFASLIVFDVTSAESFRNVGVWYTELKETLDVQSTSIFVVGAKIDKTRGREVSRSEAEETAKALGCPYRETSSVTGEGVDELFRDLVASIRSKHPPRQPQRVKLDNQKESAGGCAC